MLVGKDCDIRDGAAVDVLWIIMNSNVLGHQDLYDSQEQEID